MIRLTPLFILLLLPSLFFGATTIADYPELHAGMDRYAGNLNEGYALSEGEGLYYYNRHAGGWYQRAEGLSQKVIYPFTEKTFRHLTALGISPASISSLAVSDGQEIFYSSNHGNSWEQVTSTGELARSTFITAVLPFSERDFLVGTSGQGLYWGRKSGSRIRWKRVSRYGDPYYLGGGSFEQVSAFWIADAGEPVLYVSFGFDGGIYSHPLKRNALGRPEWDSEADWEALELPFQGEVLSFYGERNLLYCFTRDQIYRYHMLTGKWLPGFTQIRRRESVVSVEKLIRMEKARDRTGIYIRWDKAANESDYKKLLDLIVEQGYNSFVVDMKNDSGVVTYDSKVPVALEMNAVSGKINFKRLVREAHQRNLYVIARVVVFKDRQLYHYQGKRLAVWDRELDKPWGNFSEKTHPETGKKYWYQREYWVDPFSAEVWEYNRQIALELQQMGVDEVQFDYIRFPTDGKVENCTYRHRKKGMSRMDALESFLRYVREKVTLPVSTDLYGYQSYYRMGNWNGQNIELFSRYVDVISPMYYPSHFSQTFLHHPDYAIRSREIYRTGCDRSWEITQGRCVIRPYVQAFLLHDEREMDEPQYKEYLARQLEGVEMSAAEGFTLWNNSNHYYMLD